MRLTDPDTISGVIELARYAGPVFVRLPNGDAYAADVQVTNLTDNFNTTAISVSITAQELAMVDQFKIAPENIQYPEEFEPIVPEEYARRQVLTWSITPPSEGDVYLLNEAPDGEIKVELTTSYDHYVNAWELVASEHDQWVTLGAFEEDLETFLERVPEGTEFIIQAFYNV